MGIQSGKRDEVVRVFSETDNGITDGNGDLILSRVDIIAQYHVKMAHSSVKETLAAQGETPRQRIMMLGLYDRSITETMKVDWEGRIYEIESVTHHRDRDETHVLMTWAKK